MRGIPPEKNAHPRPRSALVFGLAAALLLGSFAPIGCVKAPAGESSAKPFELFRGARLYRSGTRALDAGKIDQAILDLEQAATLAPQASEIQNHLGLSYWAGGRPREAFSAFERAIALDCENEAAQENLRALERSVQDASANPWATHSATEGEHSSGR